MDQIISAAIFVAVMAFGTALGGKIYHEIQTAALTKSAQGLPPLSRLSAQLTKHPKGKKSNNKPKEAN